MFRSSENEHFDVKLCSEVKGVLYLQNFEAAVQDNVLVNGQPWEEAADVEGDTQKCVAVKS